jgi:3-methyladenine DNA glycosylase AlkD
MKIAEIMKELKKHSDPKDREGMARFGIDPKTALGVRMPVVRSLAKKIGRDHKTALALWHTKYNEARILASIVAEPDLVTERQMDAWIKDFSSWDVCDQCCMNLFSKLPFAYDKAKRLAKEEREFTRRAGFALLSCLAWQDKKAADRKFAEFFPLIIRYADDNRNFVKKAVNWALRQIGKRNPALQKKAVHTAEEILRKYPGSTSAKWVARDALRELNNPKYKE